MIKEIKSFDNTRISYLEKKGKKACIIFLHGDGTNHTVWTPMTDFFNSKGYQILALDLRGHGRSQISKRISIKAFAKDVKEVMKKEKINKAHLVGYSLGASVADYFNRAYPKKAKKIVMITPFSGKITRAGLILKNLLQFLVILFPNFNTRRKLKFQDYWKYKKRPWWYRPLLDLRGLSIKTYLTSAIALMRYEPNLNSKDTLILISKNDFLCDLRMVLQRIKSKKARVRIIDANHLVLSSHPEEVIKAISEFI